MTKVSYAHGAGGEWLGHVLEYCTVPNAIWKEYNTSFHRPDPRHIPLIETFHHVDTDDSVLSIGNGNYKYNFWKLYIHKRVLFELSYQRVNGKRLVVCPFEKYTDPWDNFQWLLTQSRFIQGYHCPGKFQIDWKDLFYSPETAWQVICNFLEHNRKQNYITFERFLELLATYKRTCLKFNFSINVNQKFFRIWQLAFLEITKENPAPFLVHEKFDSLEMKDWLLSKQEMTLDYTNNNYINIKI